MVEKMGRDETQTKIDWLMIFSFSDFWVPVPFSFNKPPQVTRVKLVNQLERKVLFLKKEPGGEGGGRKKSKCSIKHAF